ncbi:predicted protein [Nematostella vectensis]|uniref:RWD domain-containing protein n=1 Tax=Nematostella vectensis TaxID=45351 RepID=A7SUL4_NEMVE|nr:predicted protein [Nematostella vectensis]|eukprot:XP_001624702.1 predicted protein [Nematostella vectensis]
MSRKVGKNISGFCQFLIDSKSDCKPEDQPKVVLKLTPLQSMWAKEVHSRVELVIEYTPRYPDQCPKLSLQKAVGLSKENLNNLQRELECLAAELVGEVCGNIK